MPPVEGFHVETTDEDHLSVYRLEGLIYASTLKKTGYTYTFERYLKCSFIFIIRECIVIRCCCIRFWILNFVNCYTHTFHSLILLFHQQRSYVLVHAPDFELLKCLKSCIPAVKYLCMWQHQWVCLYYSSCSYIFFSFVVGPSLFFSWKHCNNRTKVCRWSVWSAIPFTSIV